MKEIRSIALCGRSLLMSALGISLQEKDEFEVQQYETCLSEIAENLNAAWPDVIIFDRATAPPDLAICLLQRHPNIILIGVDLTNNKMLVLSGEQSCLITADDLVKAIDGQLRQADLSKGGRQNNDETEKIITTSKKRMSGELTR